MWKYDARFQTRITRAARFWRKEGNGRGRQCARFSFFFHEQHKLKFFFENYAPDNNIFSGKQYHTLWKKYMRARRTFYFHFSRKERNWSDPRKRTGFHGHSFLCACDVATDAFVVFRNARFLFLNQKREERANRRRCKKETRPKLRQIRAYLSSTGINCNCSFVGTKCNRPCSSPPLPRRG